MLTHRQIEVRVQQLLDEVSVRRPPVPVRQVAEARGAVVRYEPSDGEVSGALYRQGSIPIIGVNVTQSPARQRFTIAHELGHLVLHDDLLFYDYEFATETPSISAALLNLHFRRSEASSSAKDPREIEANRFAASLLMPSRFLAASLQRLRVPLRDSDLNALAEEFEVSRQAMTYRLQNLGVPVDLAMDGEPAVGRAKSASQRTKGGV